MIIRTHAIALQIRPWSKTSHIVTWLTPDRGKVVTIIKGACRPKSAFLGQYDLFYTCDLLFYRRERGGLHAIRECTPLVLREPLRRRWRYAAAAAYLADLTVQSADGHHGTPDLFDLLTLALDRLSEEEAPPAGVILWYETQLLRILGLLPDMTLCPTCHPPDRSWLRFSLPTGRLICQHLAPPLPGEASLALHRNVRDLFFSLSQQTVSAFSEEAGLDSEGAQYSTSPNLLLGLSRFLGIFITFHLEVPSAVRRVTFEMIDITTTQHTALLENCSS